MKLLDLESFLNIEKEKMVIKHKDSEQSIMICLKLKKDLLNLVSSQNQRNSTSEEQLKLLMQPMLSLLDSRMIPKDFKEIT